jgi:hypothetical protein
MSGILLLMLASFIIASISHISSLIPETTISPSPSETYPNIYTRLLLNDTRFVRGGSGYTVYLSRPIPLNHTNFQYIIAVVSPTNVSAIKSICYDGRCYLSLSIYNNSVAYRVLPSTMINLTDYGMEAHIGGTYSLYIIEADRNASANDSLRAFFYRLETNTTTPAPAPVLSNRVIINFIAWVAGIMIMLEALRRFDLEI